MAAESIHTAVWDWLQTCPHIIDLFFHTSQTDDGDVQMIPSEELKQQYIDGSSERYYTVTLVKYQTMSDDPNDTTNIGMVVDIDAIVDWINEQFENGTLPDMPVGMSVANVEFLPNESGFMSPEQGNIGKYMLRFRIEYFRIK